MYGDLDWLAMILAAVPEDLTPEQRADFSARVAKQLVRQGLAVVLCRPGSKKATCTLTDAARKREDNTARKAAKERGSPNADKVMHRCGIVHAVTDQRGLSHVKPKALLASGANIAIAPGLSKRSIILVDTDTAEQTAEWRKVLGDEEPPTVISPGSVTPDGVWEHKDGGHFYLDPPEGWTPPERPGKLTWCSCHQGHSGPDRKPCPRAWVASWGTGYVLVPPSAREEGAYRWAGPVRPAPGDLLDLIGEAARGKERGQFKPKQPRPAGRPGEVNIDDWDAETSWEEVLRPLGWTPFSNDRCGCPTWTRPGNPANRRSATAHEAGCSIMPDPPHPIHIWTDAYGEAGVKTKFEVLRDLGHGGDTRSTLKTLRFMGSEGSPGPASDPWAGYDSWKEAGES